MSWAEMAIICPTITAGNQHAYRSQMERVARFAVRVHVDLMDKDFTPHKSVGVNEIWWPAAVKADIHVMYRNPIKYLNQIIEYNPHLVIVHAEADGDFYSLLEALRAKDIKVGLALLKNTPVSKIEPVLGELDHVLIFSGELGSFGGQADIALLEKVQAIKAINPNIEIGWDGGINEQNARQLVQGGVDVLNVGGYLQRSERPHDAYARLEALIHGVNNG